MSVALPGKDNLGDITCSNNYRAIAGGSILLKLLDIVLLHQEGHKLSFSELQFAYQASSSTTICSWAVSSVIDYFNRNGSVVYSAAMDMSKAFDMVEWSALFAELINRKIEPVFLRLLLFIYENQKCQVNWSGKTSSLFTVSNGVRQGAVSSAIFFAVYIDGLLQRLKSSRIGCYIDSVFVGAFVFADDILLLSASRAGLQSLVNICHDFASERNLKFGTHPNSAKSKTKCIAFSRRPVDTSKLAPVMLNEQKLPWVEKIVHLGCILDSRNSMRDDILDKRGKFIGKVNSLLQEFHFASPDILMKLIDVYACNFYGSCLWDLRSKEVDKIYTTWNVMVRQVFKLDRRTHKALIEPLSDHHHLKTILYGRYLGFYKKLVKSPKFTIRFLAKLNENDMRTVSGRTLRYLVETCVSDTGTWNELTTLKIKSKVKYASEGKEWQGSIAKELMNTRQGVQEIPGFSTEEIDELFHFMCTQ